MVSATPNTSTLFGRRPPSPRMSDRRDDRLREILGLQGRIDLTESELALVYHQACGVLLAGSMLSKNQAELFECFQYLLGLRLSLLPSEWFAATIEQPGVREAISTAAGAILRQWPV
jgi:hypothetical protein